MTREHDTTTSLLFPEGDGFRLINFKLASGDKDVVTPAELRDQVRSGLLQIDFSYNAQAIGFKEGSGFRRVEVASIANRV